MMLTEVAKIIRTNDKMDIKDAYNFMMYWSFIAEIPVFQFYFFITFIHKIYEIEPNQLAYRKIYIRFFIATKEENFVIKISFTFKKMKNSFSYLKIHPQTKNTYKNNIQK